MTDALDYVARAARLLYGAAWQRGLADNLTSNRHGGPISHSTVAGWFADPASTRWRSMPADIPAQVAGLIKQRIADLRALKTP